MTPVPSLLKMKPKDTTIQLGITDGTFLGTERCDFEVDRIFVRLPYLVGHTLLYSFTAGFL